MATASAVVLEPRASPDWRTHACQWKRLRKARRKLRRRCRCRCCCCCCYCCHRCHSNWPTVYTGAARPRLHSFIYIRSPAPTHDRYDHGRRRWRRQRPSRGRSVRRTRNYPFIMWVGSIEQRLQLRQQRSSNGSSSGSEDSGDTVTAVAAAAAATSAAAVAATEAVVSTTAAAAAAADGGNSDGRCSSNNSDTSN